MAVTNFSGHHASVTLVPEDGIPSQLFRVKTASPAKVVISGGTFMMNQLKRFCAFAFLLSLWCVTAAKAWDFAEPKEVAGVNSEESAWSPDGRKLAFDGSRGDKFFNLVHSGSCIPNGKAAYEHPRQ